MHAPLAGVAQGWLEECRLLFCRDPLEYWLPSWRIQRQPLSWSWRTPCSTGNVTWSSSGSKGGGERGEYAPSSLYKPAFVKSHAASIILVHSASSRLFLVTSIAARKWVVLVLTRPLPSTSLLSDKPRMR